MRIKKAEEWKATKEKGKTLEKHYEVKKNILIKNQRKL